MEAATVVVPNQARMGRIVSLTMIEANSLVVLAPVPHAVIPVRGGVDRATETVHWLNVKAPIEGRTTRLQRN